MQERKYEPLTHAIQTIFNFCPSEKNRRALQIPSNSVSLNKHFGR